MSERAQMGPTPTWLPVTLTVATILLVVAAEVREHVAAVDGPVDYCGLCHVSWSEVLPALGAVTALVVVSAAVARSGVVRSALRGGDGE